MNLFFSFQDIYNNQLNERYEDNILIYLDLRFKTTSSDEPDKNPTREKY
jgi:hypothetical protein